MHEELNLKNGFYFLDRTGPTVYFLETPPAISNRRESFFRFRCNEYLRSGCHYMCAVHLSSENPMFESCFGSLLVTNLESDVDNTFSVFATDGVGNTGEVTTYLWKIGNENSNCISSL